MRFVDVTDENCVLLPFARHLVDAVAFFEGDLECVRQAELILRDEYSRWLVSNGESYEPSNLSAAVLAATSKKTEAIYVVGLIGLAILALQSENEEASLERAFQLVEGFTADNNREEFLFWSKGSKELKATVRSLSTSMRAIRRNFDQFKSVIHICTARITANEYLEPLPMFKPTPMAEMAYISTVAAFQRHFDEYDKVHRDRRAKPLNLCMIGWKSGFELLEEPLYPTDRTMNLLLRRNLA